MSAQLVQRQNLDKNVELLAAQGQMYSRAKAIYYTQLSIDVFVPMGISVVALLLKRFCDIDISWIPTLCVVGVIILDELYFNPKVSKYKLLASKTQEQFDCDVLSLVCHPMVGSFADPEDISRFANLYFKDKGNFDYLKDWYGTVIGHVPLGIDKIICQRASVKYDHTLRTEFMEYIGWRCWLPTAALFAAAAITFPSFPDIVKFSILPSLPLIKFFFQARAANTKSTSRAEEVKRKANEVWKKVLEGTNIDYNRMAEHLQYEIFMNRRESLLIPDKFYHKKRELLEEDMNASVKRLVDEYNNKGVGPDISM